MRLVPGADAAGGGPASFTGASQGPGPCSTGRPTSPGLLEEALVRRTPRESTAGKQGSQMLAHKRRSDRDQERGVQGGVGGGQLCPEPAWGRRVGIADRGPREPRRSSWRRPPGWKSKRKGSGEDPQPVATLRVADVLGSPSQAPSQLRRRWVSAAHGRHRLAPGVPLCARASGLCRYGPPGRGVSTELQLPAAFPRLPLGPWPQESQR